MALKEYTNDPKTALRAAIKHLKEMEIDEKEPFTDLVQRLREIVCKPRKKQFYWRNLLLRYYLWDDLQQPDFRWVVTNCKTGKQETIRPRDYRGCKGGIKWNAMASAAKRV